MHRRRAKNTCVSSLLSSHSNSQINGVSWSSPWQLYDALIDLLPGDVTVTRVLLGRVALVENSVGGVGTASNDRGGRRERAASRNVLGRALRDVAALVKSWDFELASLGVATLNSWLNTSEHLEALVKAPSIIVEQTDANIFDTHPEMFAEKKVALVGHFSQGVKALSPFADLTVIEREPRGSDLPDAACEYVLPEMDAVFITGMTIANKTLPRLLDLAANARVYLVGPSVPCAPEIFGSRVQHIATSRVTDSELAFQLASIGARTPEMRPATVRFQLDIEPVATTAVLPPIEVASPPHSH